MLVFNLKVYIMGAQWKKKKKKKKMNEKRKEFIWISKRSRLLELEHSLTFIKFSFYFPSKM